MLDVFKINFVWNLNNKIKKKPISVFNNIYIYAHMYVYIHMCVYICFQTSHIYHLDFININEIIICMNIYKCECIIYI